MAAGSASWSDISATANYIMTDAFAVARLASTLAPTVTHLSAEGMNVRLTWQWQALAFTTHTEETDEASSVFYKDTAGNLTPVNYAVRADMTDERVASDPDSIREALSLEIGSAAAAHIDTNIASLFGTTSLGGTVGTGVGSTITWAKIAAAHAVLLNQGIPAGAPIYCALHPYQWTRLLSAASIAGASVAVAPAFQDRMMNSNYFSTPQAYGITFVVSNAISIAGTAAKGCLYVPQAFAVDTRKGLEIEPQRDASKQAWEMNASMWYAFGKWRPAFAVCLNFDAATPS